MSLPERKDPTHVLRILVPLSIDADQQDFDAISDAMKLMLAMSRAAFDGRICDDPQVDVFDTPNGLPSQWKRRNP